jgi:hypothetical protein
VLCERFSYEKLKVRVLACKVENFSSFLMHYYCISLIGVISEMYKKDNLSPKKAFILGAELFISHNDI